MNVFKALTLGQKQVPTGEDATHLVFGRLDAEHVLTVFSNPYCNPCAKMHERLKQLGKADLRIEYVLTAFNDELETANRYLIAAYQQLGAEKAMQILDDWYAGGKDSKDDFFKSYSLNPKTSDVDAEMQLHRNFQAV